MTRDVRTEDRTSHLFSKGVVGPFRRLCFGLFEGPGLSFDIGYSAAQRTPNVPRKVTEMGRGRHSRRAKRETQSTLRILAIREPISTWANPIPNARSTQLNTQPRSKT